MQSSTITVPLPSGRLYIPLTKLDNNGIWLFWYGTGRIARFSISTSCSTASTRMPTCTNWSFKTIVVWPFSSGIWPSISRKSIIGIMRPRRLITPLTCAGSMGTSVTFASVMISITKSVFTPNRMPSERKIKYFSVSTTGVVSTT